MQLELEHNAQHLFLNLYLMKLLRSSRRKCKDTIKLDHRTNIYEIINQIELFRDRIDWGVETSKDHI